MRSSWSLRLPCRRLAALLVLVSVCGLWATSAPGADDVWRSAPACGARPLVFRTALVEDQNEQPAAAGKAAAEKLKQAMGDAPLRAVLVSECFEDAENKQALLAGVCSVLPREIVFGQATYGSFTQAGCGGFDTVCLLGIGGEGVGVAAALVRDLGVGKLTFEQHEAEIKQRLHAAGAKLASQLARVQDDRLAVLLADAHSPKNQYLVEGVQQVLGGQFPITGGSANKNAGQTFVVFQGRVLADSAVALMLSGDFRVTLAGRKAMDNDQVIATAREAAIQALAAAAGKPHAVLAFNCAGRRGKLKRPADELEAIQTVLGRELPLFGCYCAGEVGPVDASEKRPGVLSGGSGWHVMFTVIGR
ncbi:MAG: hypothetical protein GX575_30880 [Candidatus Anammoximicrobium sp.]|nr:hypothetical protein [Candidatus Anammoximicrobium sp.]